MIDMRTDCFIGIDGGGSKTRFLAADLDGALYAEAVAGPTYYRQSGIAQVILALRDGRIVEQGRHEELLARGGFYAKLYASQFARTEDATQ